MQVVALGAPLKCHELANWATHCPMKLQFIIEKALHYYHMQPSDIEDILPPEKIAFIAYNVGIFESVQKFGNLITSNKITGGMDPVKVAELLEETRAFYDAEMIAQLINGMLAQRASMNLPSSLTIGRVTAGQVEYVIKQLKAAGISINK